MLLKKHTGFLWHAYIKRIASVVVIFSDKYENGLPFSLTFKHNSMIKNIEYILSLKTKTKENQK